MKQLFNFANDMQGLGQVLKTKSGSRQVGVGKKCSNIRWGIPGYLIYHQVYPGISGLPEMLGVAEISGNTRYFGLPNAP